MGSERTRCPKCGHMTPTRRERCEACGFKVEGARARRWHHECTCHPELADARRTQKWLREHLEVSKRNAHHFVDEHRVPGDVTTEDLTELVDTHETVIVCKSCKDIKTLGSGPEQVNQELA